MLKLSSINYEIGSYGKQVRPTVEVTIPDPSQPRDIDPADLMHVSLKDLKYKNSALDFYYAFVTLLEPIFGGSSEQQQDFSMPKFLNLLPPVF